MNDRQLLELAAKACGGQLVGTTAGYPYRGHFSPHPAEPWNPLADDGDALRLAVKLSMRVYIDGAGGDDVTSVAQDELNSLGHTVHEPHANDPLTATRRAIVRAAAAIGAAL